MIFKPNKTRKQNLTIKVASHAQNIQLTPPNNNIFAQTDRDRRPKRFLTSRQEQMDSGSVCASIQKDIPGKMQDKSAEQICAIDQLMNECRLKDEAVAKANSIIALFQQQNQDLKCYVSELEMALKSRDREIAMLQQELAVAHLDENMTFEKEFADKEVNKNYQSKSQTFYGFALSRQKNLNVHKSQIKIVNDSNPTFKSLEPDLNISKKLSPYTSKYIQAEPVSTKNILQCISMLLVKEQMGYNRDIIEELQQIVELEEGQNQMLLQQTQRMEREIQNNLRSQAHVKTKRNNMQLFTLQNDDITGYSSQSNREQSVIDKFTNIVKQYREYASYLRAYLCHCLNYLTDILKYPFCNNQTVGFEQLLRLIVRDIQNQFKHKINSIVEENHQLTFILQEIIRNLQIQRKRPENFQKCSQYQNSMKNYQ